MGTNIYLVVQKEFLEFFLFNEIFQNKDFSQFTRYESFDMSLRAVIKKQRQTIQNKSKVKDTGKKTSEKCVESPQSQRH